MNIAPTAQILKALNWRYAVKAFDPSKKLTQDQIDFVKESMRLALSSYGIQAWKFVEIKTPEIRKQLSEIGWNQTQFTDASSLFAFCTYSDPVSKAEDLVDIYIKEIIEQRKVTEQSLDGYKNMMVNAMKNGNTSGDPEFSPFWLQNQLYISLGQTMAACAIAGIDTCPIEGFDTNKATEILGLSKLGLKVSCFLAVGTRSSEDKYATTKKVRNSLDQLFLEI